MEKWLTDSKFNYELNRSEEKKLIKLLTLDSKNLTQENIADFFLQNKTKLKDISRRFNITSEEAYSIFLKYSDEGIDSLKRDYPSAKSFKEVEGIYEGSEVLRLWLNSKNINFSE